jgi:hypothetical protein
MLTVDEARVRGAAEKVIAAPGGQRSEPGIRAVAGEGGRDFSIARGREADGLERLLPPEDR